MAGGFALFLARAARAAAWVLGGAAFLVAATDIAGAQAQTIKIVNPFPPGGTGDIITRILTEQIGRSRRVPFVIEHRPGASTFIAAELVARAASDGTSAPMPVPAPGRFSM